MDEENISHKEITVEEWSKEYKDNPIQRDTVKHAVKASKPGGHLSKMHPTHRNLMAAVLPNGVKYKLDGHSRGWLWDEELLNPPPEKLIVTEYQVANRQEAMDYYRTFDAQQSVETKADRLFGAFRIHKFYPRHGYLLKNSGVMSAIEYTCFSERPMEMRALPFDVMVKPWIKILREFDAGEFTNHFIFRSPVMLAVLISMRRDGNKALSFWQAYHDGIGSKSGSKCDGIYAAEDAFRTMKTECENRWGRRVFAIYTPYFLYAYDQWWHSDEQGKKLNMKPFGNIMGKRMPADMCTVREWWDMYIGATDQPQLLQEPKLL